MNRPTGLVGRRMWHRRLRRWGVVTGVHHVGESGVRVSWNDGLFGEPKPMCGMVCWLSELSSNRAPRGALALCGATPEAGWVGVHQA